MDLLSLGTNQFYGRMLMFFQQPSKYPISPYTKYMKPKRMHLFTVIQLILFALLYTVKSIKSIAIAFPILIAACIPIRLFLLPKIFSEEELILIDSDEATVHAWLAHHDHGDESDKFIEDKDENDIEAQKPSIPVKELDGETHEGIVPQAALPPPTRPRPTRPRRDRRRSVSCPAPGQLFPGATTTRMLPEINPHMLFADSAVPRVMFEIPEHHEVHVEEETVHTKAAKAESEASFVNEAPGATTAATAAGADTGTPVTTEEQQRRPRRRRKKTVSCPTHVLFHEVNDHVNSNYFFG